MESRLPKPKSTLKKAISTLDMNTNVNVRRIIENHVLKSTSTNNIETVSEDIKKAKSTQNINLKSSNENRPPANSALTRAKTLSTITRNNPVQRTGVKRPGTAGSNAEIKRPNIRPVSKSIVNRKPGQSTTSTTSSTTTNKPILPKPCKWDLKGRLAYANDELSTLRSEHKITVAENTKLLETVNNLRTKESANESSLERLELLNANLTKEMTILMTEVNELREKNRDMDVKLNESEKIIKELSTALESYKERCNLHDAKLMQQQNKMKSLEAELESKRQINQELSTTKTELQSLVHTMDNDRRLLHNVIQELKGNIRVFCRVRPKIPKEAAKGTCALNFLDECTIEIGKSETTEISNYTGKARGSRQEFSFDKVFPPNASQAEIFEELALLVQSALEGYNVCVFAYGQTGSGKTYTMEGGSDLETEGMIPRTVRHIFKEMKQFQLLGWQYRIEASFLEIYNEHIVDLLDTQSKTHEIRMTDSKGADVYVSNLQVEVINSPEELQWCLGIAQQNRAVAATLSNERSSRSHSVARIRLIGTHTTKEETCIGNLNLVDLAGSERLKTDEAARTTETKNINKSLANLGNVILALLKKQDHVPYRNSKLTHLLMPSLGGNSKTLMLLNVSPLDECYNETLNSLRFASNVNSCKTGSIKRTRTILHN